jgi:hypothetical protein
MLPRVLQPVAFYVWRDGPEMVKVPKADWWDGTIRKDGKRSYIVVSPAYQEYREPDEEQLACLHFQPIKVWGGRKYYNRRRLCKECALNRAAGDAPADMDANPETWMPRQAFK